MANPYGCTADTLIRGLEASDAAAHACTVHRGRIELAVLQLLTAGAVLLARRLERLDR